MSQGYATARTFPEAPPLSADNPGRLIPARMGYLPGALPGRSGGVAGGPPFGGGAAATDITAPVVPPQNGQAIRRMARETVPANAANLAGLPSHLVNGLPFQRMMGGSPTPVPDESAPLSQVVNVGTPFAAPAPTEPVAPPPRVHTPPPMDAMGLDAPTISDAAPPAGMSASPAVPEAPLAPPVMAPAPPPRVEMPSTAPSDSVSTNASDTSPMPTPSGQASHAGATDAVGAVPSLEPERAGPSSGESPWMREISAAPPPVDAYRPPVPEAPSAPAPQEHRGGGAGRYLIMVATALVVAGVGIAGLLYKDKIFGGASQPDAKPANVAPTAVSVVPVESGPNAVEPAPDPTQTAAPTAEPSVLQPPPLPSARPATTATATAPIVRPPPTYRPPPPIVTPPPPPPKFNPNDL